MNPPNIERTKQRLSNLKAKYLNIDLPVRVVQKGDIEALLNEIDGLVEYIEYLESAFYAAKAFIDCHAGDPDITSEMIEKYQEYQKFVT